MQTSIALSTAKIIDNVMAHSALRHLLDPQRPPLLTLDQRPALQVLVRSVITKLAMTLQADVKPDDELSDITVLALQLPPGNQPSSIRSAIEFAVVSEILAKAYRGADPDYSATCQADADIAATSLRSIATGTSTILPSIF